MNAPVDLAIEKPRISSIDLLRGIVMVIMALDHTRDFFHIAAFSFNPTDPAKTTAAIFFTRWITHFCAPTFVLLSGTSIRLSRQRKSVTEMSRFLFTRGLWLVLLELTVGRFAFVFNVYYDFVGLLVIYAIGVSMMIMAALIHLKEKVVFGLGILITFGHNIFDTLPVAPGSPLYGLCVLAYQGGPISIDPHHLIFVGYPFLPWLGIMLLGYSMGGLYLKGFDASRRQKLLVLIGSSAILLFMVVRAINVYGDPVPWQFQKETMRTLFSFLNCTKYPVSLLFTLMTLGPVLLFLCVLEKIPVHRLRPAEVFGRVPMFYYFFHFYLIHALAILSVIMIRHKNFSSLDFHFFTDSNPPALSNNFGGVPFDSGYPLIYVYLVWAFVIFFTYPFCKKFNEYKSTHNQWWLSYL